MTPRAMPFLALFATLLAPAGATAAPGMPQAAPAPPVGTFNVQYDGYAHGLIVLKLKAALTLTPTSYSGRLTYRTAGFVGFMVHNDSDSQVQGRFAGTTARPLLFESTGSLRGVHRETRISFEGDPPEVLALAPPVETERSPVPRPLTAHSIDTLSAITLLVRQVAQTGRCEGEALTFDGRRLTHMTAHTTGKELLAADERGKFNGLTLRCDFDGDQLAGFVKGEDPAALKRTHHGTAWLAPLAPGTPPLPVRVVFTNKVLGEVTLYLTAHSETPGPVAQAAVPIQTP